jgi:hypothetical protein
MEWGSYQDTDPEVYYYTSNGNLHGTIGTVNGRLNGLHGTENGTLNGLHGTIGTVNGTLNGLHGTIRTENGTLNGFEWRTIGTVGNLRICISETLAVITIYLSIRLHT